MFDVNKKTKQKKGVKSVTEGDWTLGYNCMKF